MNGLLIIPIKKIKEGREIWQKIDINEKPKSHPSVMWDNSSIAELPSDSLLEEGELDVYKKIKRGHQTKCL